MSRKNFESQAARMLRGLEQMPEIKPEVPAPQVEAIEKEIKEQTVEPVNVEKVASITISEDKMTKLMIELPLSESMRINRIVDQHVLNGEKYSKKKFLTDAVLEAINKYDK